MNDEPLSLLALAIAVVLAGERMFLQYVAMRQKRANGTSATRERERGSASNGHQAILVRLDAVDVTLVRLQKNHEKLWERADEVGKLCAVLNERTKKTS